ncbi:MAG TPA: DUF4264 family protein [Limnochordales bacterium]
MPGKQSPETGAPVSADAAIGNGPAQQLQVLASETLALQGEVHRLVTFLNQSLKEEGFIFGLTRVGDGRYRLSIYRA